jgi:hypothetical protein
MYTINFFTLQETESDAGDVIYIEELENNKLELSSLDDVKHFLSSNFYDWIYEIISENLDGIVITDKDDEIIYKERFNTDTLFDVYTDEKGNTIYKALGAIEDDNCNYVMIDKLSDKVRVNYDTLNS